MAIVRRSSSRRAAGRRFVVFFEVFAAMLEFVPTELAGAAAAEATSPAVEDPPPSSVTGVSGGRGMLPALALG